jgi:hypothetical protein
MSIFGNILSKIFGSSSANAAPDAAAAASGATAAPGTMAAPGTGAAPATAAMPAVDVEAVLSGLAAKSGQQSNWQTSIVDMMKLLGLDSSLASRKQLAQELGYTGDMNDSATMNIWLHKAVMTKLAENGGKVPDSMKH